MRIPNPKRQSSHKTRGGGEPQQMLGTSSASPKKAYPLQNSVASWEELVSQSVTVSRLKSGCRPIFQQRIQLFGFSGKKCRNCVSIPNPKRQSSRKTRGGQAPANTWTLRCYARKSLHLQNQVTSWEELVSQSVTFSSVKNSGSTPRFQKYLTLLGFSAKVPNFLAVGTNAKAKFQSQQCSKQG